MKAKMLGLLFAAMLLCALPFVSRAEAPTFADAAAQLRQQLEAREPVITVSFFREEALEDPVMDLFWAAVEHTGVPTQGDYLRWHLDGLDYEEDCREEGDGYVYTLTYSPIYFSTAEEEQLLDEAVENLLKELNLTYLSDYHKARAIYDYICSYVVYDESTPLRYSAYAALVEKQAVCQGFATLFYRLALEAGLDCRVISGQAGGVRHGWNIVKIRDMYYCLDATWDAGAANYTRFLKGSKYFYYHAPDAEFMTEAFQTAFPLSETNYITRRECFSHSFTVYRSNRDATCIADGTETAVCDVCEATDTRVLAETALGHHYETYYTNGDATMYQDGTKTAQCSRCDSTDTQPDPGSRLPKQGWLLEDGYWYYYKNDRACSGWVKTGQNWYYLQSNSKMATGWVQTGGVWYYLRQNGAMATGWVKSGDYWYYLHTSGAMATGWVKTGGVWYYLRQNGAMATGWVKSGNYWYYLRASGAMVTGTLVIDGITYRFDENGTWRS